MEVIHVRVRPRHMAHPFHNGTWHTLNPSTIHQEENYYM